MSEWNTRDRNLRALFLEEKRSRGALLVEKWRIRVDEFNQENKRLWKRIEELEELLREHGIEPPAPEE